MACAYMSGVFPMAMIAEHFGVRSMTVSRAVRKQERDAAQSADGSRAQREAQVAQSD